MNWLDKKKFNPRDRDERLSDKIEVHKYTSGEFYTIRPVGPMLAVRQHWIRYRTKAGKVININKACAIQPNAKDGEGEQRCGYCEYLKNRPTIKILQNAIVRTLQEQEPKKRGKPTERERKAVPLWGGKAKGLVKQSKTTEAWTPVRAFELPSSVASKIADMASLNKVKTKDGPKSFGPEHVKYGFDITIKRDDTAASPMDMYFVQKEGRAPLTEEEAAYLIWRLDALKPPTYEETLAEAKKLGKGLVTRGKDNVDVDSPIEDPDAPVSAKSKRPSLENYADLADDDDDSADQQSEGDDDDADEKSVKKKKSGDKLKKKLKAEREGKAKEKAKKKLKSKSKDGKKKRRDADSELPF